MTHGTRLWPLSRPETPKPFLPLLDDRSLLQRTFDRIVGAEMGLRPDDVAVVTERRYGPMVREHMAQVGVGRVRRGGRGGVVRPASPSFGGARDGRRSTPDECGGRSQSADIGEEIAARPSVSIAVHCFLLK